MYSTAKYKGNMLPLQVHSHPQHFYFIYCTTNNNIVIFQDNYYYNNANKVSWYLIEMSHILPYKSEYVASVIVYYR